MDSLPLRKTRAHGAQKSQRKTLLTYCGGIGAVASDSYENLKSLLLAQILDGDDYQSLAVALNRGLSELGGTFKTLPGHERQCVPQSEHLFKRLQPQLDDLLFLGADYERNFDRFEILLALVHAHNARHGTFLGRFAWKYARLGSDSPFHKLVEEAGSHGDAWPPLEAGLFGGSHQTFKDVATKLAGSSQRLC